MKKSKVVFGIILSSMTLAVLVVAQDQRRRSERRIVSARTFSQVAAEKQRKGEGEEVPIFSYGTVKQVDAGTAAKQRAHSQRYNRRGMRRIEDSASHPYLERIGMDHWWEDLSAIPVEQSDIVVVGTVKKAEAHLSEDETSVYAEFEILIEEVLKTEEGKTLYAGSLISTERPGGAIRFPSGHVQRQKIREQGLPRKGRRYLLFLKRLDETEHFSVVTGYELAGTKVIPLDGTNGGGRSYHLMSTTGLIPPFSWRYRSFV